MTVQRMYVIYVCFAKCLFKKITCIIFFIKDGTVMSNSIPAFAKEIFILRIAVISITSREEVKFFLVFNLFHLVKFYALSLDSRVNWI